MSIDFHEDYSIDVHEDYIVVWGWLTVPELNKIINLFQPLGFSEVAIGKENSTLVLMKPSKEKR